MPVTFADKDNTLPVSDPRKLIRAVDVNELKTVINATESTINTVLAGAPGAYNTFLEVSNKFTAVDTAQATHAALTNNPHSVTKAQIGLSDVENTSDAAKIAAVLAKFVFKETPSGTIDGVNDTFTLAFPVATVIGVYSDGIVTNSTNYNYVVLGTTLIITNALVIPTNSLQIDYIK